MIHGQQNFPETPSALGLDRQIVDSRLSLFLALN